MKYKFCPQCGSELKPKMAGDDGEVPFCYECNKYWFDSFESCVIVLVYNEFDEIVVCMQEWHNNCRIYFTGRKCRRNCL